MIGAQSLDAAERLGSTFAILFFDIDNLEQINAAYGHGIGDEALCETGSNAERERAPDGHRCAGGRRRVLASRLACPGGTGYRVNFVVDVSHCVWIATIGRHTPTAPGIFSIVPSDAGVYLSPIDGGGSPQSVFVATYLGGAPASSDFHLLIRC